MTTSRRRTAAAAARSTPLSGLSRPTTRAAMRALSPGGRASSASAAPTTKPTPARPLPAGQFAPAPPSHVSPHAHHRQARPPFSRCPPFRRARRRLHRDDRDANRSTVWAPSSSTRAGSDMAESRSFENLQRLASQVRPSTLTRGPSKETRGSVVVTWWWWCGVTARPLLLFLLKTSPFSWNPPPSPSHPSALTQSRFTRSNLAFSRRNHWPLSPTSSRTCRAESIRTSTCC
mmetsp:Transcript_71444/g.201589  ORF Transcript_71444/g.201589 Transcript_71444/m.201589 type:complete len:232 (+) Transcript_71444:193-888(+)